MTQAICFIGLGSNLGASCEQLRLAISELAKLPDTYLLASSSFYRSAPVGYLDQPDFINAVVKMSTPLTPQALLASMLHIESKYGRERAFSNAPRTLDLDILLYEDRWIHEPSLTVPHPQMHRRAFVLQPLLEIEPDCDIPLIGRAAYALQDCLDQVLVKLAD
ncbi:MAG: 2-amino-4-hydroxy-6-hydroxymethyldihydropteridine diphosphokinase [Gallionella sp.]